MSQVRPLRVQSPRVVQVAGVPATRAPEGRGRGVEPAHPRPHAPLPPAVRLPCHCPILAPRSPETQSVLCLSAHSAARSHQLVFVPSHPALHTKETWDRAASPPRTPEGGGRTRERTPPRGARPCLCLGSPGSSTARPQGGADRRGLMAPF